MKKIIPLLLFVLMLRVWIESTMHGAGTGILLNSFQNEWLAVQLDDGKIAYVSSKWVTKSKWVEVTESK